MKELVLIALTTLTLVSCAHSDYHPEVSGPGAIENRGGVVYKIPPGQPVIAMKVVTLGITKEDQLRVRMYFKRTGGAKARVSLDPKEQLLTLPDSKDGIAPSRVHAPTAAQPMIVLGSQDKQTVELDYPVGQRSHDKYPYFEVHWKVHYGTSDHAQTETQIARFDRVDHKIPQGLDAEYDRDYPYVDEEFLPESSEWNTPGWLWW